MRSKRGTEQCPAVLAFQEVGFAKYAFVFPND
jgi:hypothetical protein